MSETSRWEADPDAAWVGTSPGPEVTVGAECCLRTASCARSRSAVAEHLRGAALLPHERGAHLFRRRNAEFNLLGLDRWVRNFCYVTYYDGWDGAHPRVFTPKHKPYIEFESGEEINNWLLINPEVRAYMSRPASRGQRPKVAMVFFDAETERICDELGYDLILPPRSSAAPGLKARHYPVG